MALVEIYIICCIIFAILYGILYLIARLIKATYKGIVKLIKRQRYGKTGMYGRRMESRVPRTTRRRTRTGHTSIPNRGVR